MKKGIFTISLDFELLWGIFDKVGTNYRQSYFSNTRKLIPEMLDLFAEYKVAVTWATVGMLFAENEEEWKTYSPINPPKYREKDLSAYEWTKIHGIRPAVHFAPELIRQILDTPDQELGSHTFAHYYTMMRGQSPAQFREDLKATQRIAKAKFGVKLSSLVFPRNQINELYLPICLEEGYTQVRSNPKNWFWQDTQHEYLSKKLFRSADCFFSVMEKTSYPAQDFKQLQNEPLLIPASRILRPFSKLNRLFNSVRLRRAKEEMKLAASINEIYHLWWHPHNFGIDPQGTLKELQEILLYFSQLNDQFGMESKNMAQLGEMYRQNSQNRVLFS
jgi:peptidoglycan/xylan/chitin deacetylase (PgdA/CDA1 family)